jgi:hypothetical protein
MGDGWFAGRRAQRHLEEDNETNNNFHIQIWSRVRTLIGIFECTKTFSLNSSNPEK